MLCGVWWLLVYVRNSPFYNVGQKVVVDRCIKLNQIIRRISETTNIKWFESVDLLWFNSIPNGMQLLIGTSLADIFILMFRPVASSIDSSFIIFVAEVKRRKSSCYRKIDALYWKKTVSETRKGSGAAPLKWMVKPPKWMAHTQWKWNLFRKLTWTFKKSLASVYVVTHGPWKCAFAQDVDEQRQADDVAGIGTQRDVISSERSYARLKQIKKKRNEIVPEDKKCFGCVWRCVLCNILCMQWIRG